MQNFRKVKRRKVIETNNNIEQSAQDKLLEISIFADDRYEDESKLLSIENRPPPEPSNKKVNMSR